jgi:hypothetical protein
MASRHQYLPELLGRVLSSNTLQDLCSTGVLVGELCVLASASTSTSSRAHENAARRTGNIVDSVVDDDVHAGVGGLVGGDLVDGEFFRHVCWMCLLLC